MLFFRAEGVSQQWQPSIWAIVQAEGTMLSEWREELEEESRGREGGTDEENNSRGGQQEEERQEEQDCEERGDRTETDSESEAHFREALRKEKQRKRKRSGNGGGGDKFQHFCVMVQNLSLLNDNVER